MSSWVILPLAWALAQAPAASEEAAPGPAELADRVRALEERIELLETEEQKAQEATDQRGADLVAEAAAGRRELSARTDALQEAAADTAARAEAVEAAREERARALVEAYRYLAQADLALESGDLDVGELLGFADALLAGAGASAEQMGQGRSALHTEQARGFVARAFEATTRRDVAAARRAIQAGAAEVNEARAQNLDRGDASLVQGAGAR